MANRNVERAVRCALLAASAASAGFYSNGVAAQQAAAAQEELEQIVVTGSRIARPGVEEASPIAVIGSDEIAMQGTVNIENVLFTLPQVVATQSSASNNPGGGVATVNLRGLGSQRTLVLVDGKRYISYDVNQVVDLNTIPSALIERIDVVTGGRSAVYGSDAIAGVVNFVTKRNFEGAEVNSIYGTSEKGDGSNYGLDLTVGGNFGDDRGNAVVHAGYFNRSGLLAGERSYTQFALTDAGDGTAFNGGSSGIPQLRARITGLNTALGFGGTDVKFSPDGVASQYSPTADLYNYAPSNYLQVPQERYLVYGKARYDVNDNFKPYVEAQFVNNRVDQQLAPTPIGNTTPGVSSRGGLLVHAYSPFIDAATQTALQGLDTDGDGYVAVPNFGRRIEEVGPRIVADDRSAYRLLAGFGGDVYGDWTYDASYMYARTRNSQNQDGNVAISRYLAGTKTAFMNADGDVQVTPWNIAGLPNGGAGELVCSNAGARDAGCVPINHFGQGNISGDAANYIRIGTINGEIAETKLASILFSNGNLWDGWGAGPIGLAAGFEHRTESGENQTDEFLAGGDVAGFNPSDPTKGSYTVADYFGEINVPILRDAFLAQTLEFNGAVRYSDYSNEVGGVTTWAAGGQWAPVRGMTFRGQYQRAIRGPSVAELYLGQTVSFDGGVDPCRNADAAAPGALRDACIATGVPAGIVGTPYGSGGTSYPALQGGNPDLFEETADTWSVGFVLQPAALPNFIATVDYYNIQIEDLIATVGAQNIITACYGSGVFCDQIYRDSTGEFESFDDFNVNAASLDTEGVDVELGYNMDLGFGTFGGDGSTLAFRLNGTYTMKWDYTPVVGLDIVNECAGAFGRNCGAPLPDWGHSFRTTWSTGPFDASVMWRYIGSTEDDDKETLYAREEFSSMSYIDFTFGWEFTEGVKVQLGVDNAFNEEPELGASTQQGGNVEQSNTFPTVFDVIGRSYWATLNLKF